MKNIGKILLLSFMTIGLVAGCDLSDFKNLLKDSSDSSQNDNSDSSNNKNEGEDNGYGDSNSSSSNNSGNSNGGNAGSDSSNNNGGGNNNQGWSDEYAAIMSAHLYGTILPYTGDADTVVEYDADYDMVTLVGGDVTLAGYQAALIADDYGLVGEDEETGAFAVEKEVSTTDGRRFVYVYAEMDEEDGFSAQAFDPYYYSWPADQLEAFFEDWDATPFDVPTIDAENAYFAFEEDQYNIWYYILEMEDYINASLIAYNCSQSDFTTYYAKLGTAGWEIKSQTVEGETYYSCILNIENVGVAQMDLYYSAEYEAIALTIYAYMSAPDIIPGVTYESWPAIQIATMLGSGIKDTVPAYTGTNNGFQLLDDYYGMAAVVLVDEGTEAAGAADYVAALPDAGYVLDGVTAIGDDRYVSPNEEIYVSVYPAATPGTITIYFEAAEPEVETAEWPTSRVSSALSALVPEAKDTIPALEGANNYNVFEESGSFQIQAVYSTASEANSAKSAYATTLKTAGFTEGGEDKYGDMNYNSPNKEFYINMWYSSQNGYKVILDVYAGEYVPAEANTEWPKDEIDDFMAANSFTDVLPTFEGGNDYMVDDGGDELYIMIDVDDPEQALEDYIDALEDAEFIFDSYDNSDGSPYYWSPNEQYIVNPYISQGGYLVIWVF